MSWLELAHHSLVLAQSAAPTPATPDGGADTGDPALTVEGALIRTLIAAGPVGVFFLATLFKKGIMTVSEHTSVVAAFDREREAWGRERETLEKDIGDLKAGLKDAQAVYTQQVIPTLTRVLDAERELVDLRRDEQAERRRRAGGS